MYIWCPIRKQCISPKGAARLLRHHMKFSWNALALAPLPVLLTVAFPVADIVTAVLYRHLAGHPSREDATTP